jgi:hypothetical protein
MPLVRTPAHVKLACACSNGIPLGWTLFLPFGTVNCVKTLKGASSSRSDPILLDAGAGAWVGANASIVRCHGQHGTGALHEYGGDAAAPPPLAAVAVENDGHQGGGVVEGGYGARFWQKVTFKDVIGSHACSLEALENACDQ